MDMVFAHARSPCKTCTVLRFRHRTSDLFTSFYLIFPYRDPVPLITRRYIGLPLSYLLSLIPPHLRSTLVLSSGALLILLSVAVLYLVRYIDSQSGGTVGLGLCPLRLVTLLARVS